MKCFYKIVMEDGKVIPYFVPNSLKKTDQDMFYFDYFACACRDKKTFYEQIKKLAKIKDGEIDKISIDYKRDKNNKNHNPYNIEFNNPYIKEAVKTNEGKYINIKRQKVRVLGKNVFEDNVVVIDKNSELYRNTSDYLFDNLKNNSEVFFKSIYNKNNDYSVILKQYVELYKNVENETASSEELEELHTKERDIKDQLSKYRTFRSFAIARYKYEQRLERKKEKEELKEERKTYEKLAKEMPKVDPNDGLMDVSDYFERYNQEHEEYIEETEYEQMAPNESVPRR